MTQPVVSRRHVLKQITLAGTGLAFGANLFANALLEEKKDLKILTDHPLNAETPPHLLDDEITPSECRMRGRGVRPMVTASPT